MTVVRKINPLIVALLTLLSFSSCEIDLLGPCMTEEGNITTEVINLTTFNKIELDGSMNVSITQGDVQQVRVIGHANIIDRLKTTVFNKRWDIELKNGCYKNVDLIVEITVPNIESVKVSGSGHVVINDFENQPTLHTEISGSGQIEINKFEGTSTLSTEILGSGTFKTNSTLLNVDALHVEISGSGKYKGFNLSAQNAKVKISGSGRCELTALKNLNAKITGSGKIFYRGNPNVTKQVSGSGTIIKVN